MSSSPAASSSIRVRKLDLTLTARAARRDPRVGSGIGLMAAIGVAVTHPRSHPCPRVQAAPPHERHPHLLQVAQVVQRIPVHDDYVPFLPCLQCPDPVVQPVHDRRLAGRAHDRGVIVRHHADFDHEFHLGDHQAVPHGGTPRVGSEHDPHPGPRRPHQAVVAPPVGDRPLPLADLPFGNVVPARDLGLRLDHDRRERGDDRHAPLQQLADGAVRHAAAVLHGVDSEIHGPLDRGVEGGVRGDGQPAPVRLVDDGLEFLIGELQQVVAHHDLDQVGAGLHLLPHGAPHLVRPGGLAAAPVGVAAGLHDRLGADQQARAREHPLLHRLLGELAAPVHPQVAHHRDSAAQVRQHVGRRLVGADLGRVVHRLCGEVVDPVPGQVGVAVDQAGQDRSARREDRPSFPRGRVPRPDRHDPAPLQRDVAVLDHLLPHPRDHAAAERDRCRLARRQILQNRLKLPGWCFGHVSLPASDSEFRERPGAAVEVGELHARVVGRVDDARRPVRVCRVHALVHDFGGTGGLVRAGPGCVDADPHQHRQFAVKRLDGGAALATDIAGWAHSRTHQLVPRRLVEPQNPVHDRRHLGGRQVPQQGRVQLLHLAQVDPARLVLVGDRLDPVRVVLRLGPRPLRLAERVEVVAIPHVEPELQRRIAPLDEPVQLAVQVLVAADPVPLEQQEVGVVEQHAKPGDQRAVGEVLARARLPEVVVEQAARPPRGFRIDATGRHGSQAVPAEAPRSHPGDQLVEWAPSLVAPHDAVDVVAPAVVLDERVPPGPVVRVLQARRPADPAQVVHLHVLDQVRNLHGVGRSVPRVLEQRLHQLGDHLHPPRPGLGNDHFEYVAVPHGLVRGAEVGDGRVAVELGMVRQVRPALHLQRLGHAVVRPAVDLPRDAAPDLQAQPADRAQQDHVHAHALLQRVEHRVHTLVHEAGGPDLDAYEPLVHSRLAFSLGSSVSCKLSPRRFVAITTVNMASPGNVEIHHAGPSTSRPTATISPHSGVGGCAPSPRKLRPAPTEMACPNSSVDSTSSGTAVFGSTCRSMIRTSGTPISRAASMYACSRTVSTVERTKRA